jgi:hypothetical protein
MTPEQRAAFIVAQTAMLNLEIKLMESENKNMKRILVTLLCLLAGTVFAELIP